MVKHPDWKHLWQDFNDDPANWDLIPTWYILDLLSLVKARFIRTAMLQKSSLLFLLLFFFMDVVASYILVLLWTAILVIIFMLLPTGVEIYYSRIYDGFILYLQMYPITYYISMPGNDVLLSDVIVVSTLLTSMWTLLLFFS